MAQKPIRDWVYLAIISVQLFGMFDSLYGNPSAPFHFLTIIRDTYLTVSGDPFFGDKFVGDWFHGFLWLELLVQCPLAIYIVSQLSSKSPSSGATELAGLAFGCLTGMGTVACVSELIPMGPELVSEEHKTNLLYGTYLPFLIIRKSPDMLHMGVY
ncbi:uncharacterized protein NECHADRAFT_106302 [Fusarium vanettenii 77-13-4]|uniref:EXPERA domain-containing protein n=1 Tax=Fusarium vanettenii (strain ATCC MYA-4622 / CBS 123669 / FGSC 9596 / NRRL 45880 / 77-13-4) TaxID=660122 RepID=C7YYB1_FUSV7|nr:uncharacterized protein NECHADRAFT_106302 [Fusarium vanettenii 77-13-4]EEU42975.1 hypothetical protein NECHADRAFT_106302 [Fusarium vanettenii 77-13-4]